MNRPSSIVKAPATYQDVLDAPPHMVAEIIEGTLSLQPRPRPKHAKAHSGLVSLIGAPFDYSRDGPGGWTILTEPELHLGSDIVVPDLGGWRRERMPSLPDAAYFTLAPDWVCEVLSPSTRKLDLTAKRAIYGREGVSHLWFIDADAKTLEVFALQSGEWVLKLAAEGGATVEAPPFEAVPLDLTPLWVPDAADEVTPPGETGG